MSVEHKIVKSLKIVGKDNTVKLNASGKVVLAGGAGVSIDTDETEAKAFVINAGVSAATGTDYYIQKYNAVIGGGSGVGYSFSGINNGGYWVATINNMPPHKAGGAFCMAGSTCGQVGEFPVVTRIGGIPTQAVVETANNTLSVFDMCTADVDCEDYYKLFTYLKIIKTALDANKDKNLDDPTSTKLFPQYQAAVHFWNYLANIHGIIFEVSGSSANVKITTGYRAMACGPYSNVFWTVSIEQEQGQPGLEVNPAVTGRDATRPALLAKALIDEQTVIATVEDVMSCTEYSIINIVMAIRLSTPPPSSSSSVSYTNNSWIITATFYNTHIGTPITLTKKVYTRLLTPP